MVELTMEQVCSRVARLGVEGLEEADDPDAKLSRAFHGADDESSLPAVFGVRRLFTLHSMLHSLSERREQNPARATLVTQQMLPTQEPTQQMLPTTACRAGSVSVVSGRR
eukprot:69348-Prymnesium_polylepis.1